MADPFVAEIRIFGCNFPPKGWAQCNGQIMPISQNTALFSLLGTTYGGDGRTNFALPNIQGKGAIHQGQGPGLSLRDLGELGGEPTVTLQGTQMASHNHSAMGKALGGKNDPGTNIFGTSGTQLPPPNFYSNALGSQQAMSQQALSITGNSQPHNNLMPYQVLNYCIALNGIYPPRS